MSASLCLSPGQIPQDTDPTALELFHCIEEGKQAVVRLECNQSEEGGRFYRDENRYQIVELQEGVEISESKDYRWVTLAQIRQLICIPGALTIELRGVLAMLLYWV